MSKNLVLTAAIGFDISQVQLFIKSLRNICSYIEQKPSFMRGTIIEHIAYNNKKIN